MQARYLKQFSIADIYPAADWMPGFPLKQGELNGKLAKKFKPLETLYLPITWSLRKLKQHTEPQVSHAIVSVGSSGQTMPLLRPAIPGDPLFLELQFHKPIEEMLDLEEDNSTLGEFAIEVTETLVDGVREGNGLVKNFPVEAFEAEIENFRVNGYSFSVSGKSSPIFETDLRAKFEIHANCEEITSTMVLLHGRKELDRRIVRTFPGGQYVVAQNFVHILLEDGQMEVTNYVGMSTFIPFDDFPASVRALLPAKQP